MHDFIEENNDTRSAEMRVFEPVEIMQIALEGAAAYLEANPNISESKRKAALEILAQERVEQEQKLKVVTRRYKIALNRALVYEAQNKDTAGFSLQYKDPSMNAPGYIQLTAQDLNFDDSHMLKSFSGASSITVRPATAESSPAATMILWFAL